MLRLPKYSFGVGDRFGQSSLAQLEAFQRAADDGIAVTPVWNKSNREHLIIGSEPGETRRAAERAVRDLDWIGAFFVDADHINLDTVDRFLEPCDYFTIDVAEWIGRPVSVDEVEQFLGRHPELESPDVLLDVDDTNRWDRASVAATAQHYLAAVAEAGRVYRHITSRKGRETVTEVSMDETERPQTPRQLLVILAAIADEGIPLQTIAPKFTGRFNKGVDYVGNRDAFAEEFAADLNAIAYAAREYGLPENLKLSVHTGSDKFSLYEPIGEAIRRHDAGVHVKTAGTSWLAELIGLAQAGGPGLDLAKRVYREALECRAELCAPYAAVIEIDAARLPSAASVAGWTADDFVSAVRHDPADPRYNPDLRQLLHVGFKVAARYRESYVEALRAAQHTVSLEVTTNLFERHIRPLLGHR